MSVISKLKENTELFYRENMCLTAIETNTIRIDTPFLGRHNDTLIFYAIEQPNQQFKLTDGGYILDDWEQTQIDSIHSQHWLFLLKEQLRNLSVNLDTDTHEITVITTIQDYATKQNLLIQAMLFTNDLLLLLSNGPTKTINPNNNH